MHSVHQKTSKGKKIEKKRNEQRYLYSLKKKKKSYWEIWNSKLKKRHCRTSTGRRHKSYKQGGSQNVDVKSVDEDVIKFKM